MDEIVDTYTLKTPLIFGDREIKELKFRELKGRDIRQCTLTNLSVDSLLVIAEKLTGETGAVFDRMTGKDVIEVCGAVGKQLEESPTDVKEP